MQELSKTQAGFALTGTTSGTASFARQRNDRWFQMALRSMKNPSQPNRFEISSAVCLDQAVHTNGPAPFVGFVLRPFPPAADRRRMV